jgi:RNA polymerase sigma factor (sigma-70 family)
MSCSRSRRGHTVASLHERALLRAAQQDDRHALEELLRRYEPLARAIAGRLRLPAGCDRCDVVQEARLGVLAAIRVWRPDRGPFGALAAQCAKARAINAVDAGGARKQRLLSLATSLQDAPASGQGRRRHQPAIVVHGRHGAVSADGDPVAILLTREQLAEIRAALPTLTARERIALAGVLNDRTHRQLAADHDTSRKAIASAVARARTKLAVGEALAA